MKMKLVEQLEICLQQFVDETTEPEHEVELGFDTMLSDEAVKLVHASHSANKLLAKKMVRMSHNGLDEYELAMA
jgi:hypothetical protein